jgi:hypothetical protein
MEGISFDAVHIRSAGRRAGFIILARYAHTADPPDRLALPRRLVQSVYDRGTRVGELVACENRASNRVALVEVINRDRRLELTIDDHPSTRDLLPSDPERPHRKPSLIPRLARGHADPHGLVGRVKDADGPDIPWVADAEGYESSYAMHALVPLFLVVLFGEDEWVNRMASELRLKHTVRREGRPPKPGN